ncbi:hypothetical protein ACFE04_015319 [Oxalis oulophora]
MGCKCSKTDDLPLVTVCRERKELIEAAFDQRCVLAAAHVAYFDSLNAIGDAIKRFVDQELVISDSTSPPDSPLLTLPNQGKGKNRSSSSDTSISHSVRGSSSDTDSHLHIMDSDSSSSGHIHFDDEDDNVHEHDHGKHNHSNSSVNVERELGRLYRGGYSYFPGESSVYQPPPRVNLGTLPLIYNYTESQAVWRPPRPAAYDYPPPHQANWKPPPPPPPRPHPLPVYNYPYNSMNLHYMKKAPTPSKSFTYGEAERYQVVSSSDSGFVYPTYYQPSGGFFGLPVSGSYGYGQPSPRRPAPAQPLPPNVSTWDYLNVFDTFNVDTYSGYYSKSRLGSTTSSLDSHEVRQKEGIPDLEDDTETELLKRKVHRGKLKKKIMTEAEMNYQRNSKAGQFPSSSSSSEANRQNAASQKKSETLEPSMKGKDIANSYSTPDIIVTLPTMSEEGSIKKKEVSFEVDETHTVDVESSELSSLTTLSVHSTRDLKEVVNEIRDEFKTAWSYGTEVAALLEVGRLPYLRRNTPLKAMFSRIPFPQESLEPSIQLSSRIINLAKAYSTEHGKDFNIISWNLSLTLEKLYAWEKKLYKEVKDEERLRVSYEKQCKKLRNLGRKGAESSKLEATEALIKRLQTKIDICIRAAHAISNRIHKLRDEELQPQLKELIRGLTQMWKSILKCHQKQFQAITKSKVGSIKANTGFQGDAGLKATVELEVELLNWCDNLNSWVDAQKRYAKFLNEWLKRCIIPESVVTDDGVAPFSPGRVGAPPIFVICNDWSQSMAKISEKSVGDAMRQFASNLHELWERQDEEKRQRVKAEFLAKDFEKQFRTLRMEQGRMKDEQDAASETSAMLKVLSESRVSALDDLKVDLDMMKRKLKEERMRHKETVKLVHNAASSSLQGGLIPIFEALCNFTSEVVKAYERVRLDYSKKESMLK